MYLLDASPTCYSTPAVGNLRTGVPFRKDFKDQSLNLTVGQEQTNYLSKHREHAALYHGMRRTHTVFSIRVLSQSWLRCLASLASTASTLQTCGLIGLERIQQQNLGAFPPGGLSRLAVILGDSMPHAVASACEDITASTLPRFTFYRFLSFLCSWNTDSILA